MKNCAQTKQPLPGLFLNCRHPIWHHKAVRPHEGTLLLLDGSEEPGRVLQWFLRMHSGRSVAGQGSELSGINTFEDMADAWIGARGTLSPICCIEVVPLKNDKMVHKHASLQIKPTRRFINRGSMPGFACPTVPIKQHKHQTVKSWRTLPPIRCLSGKRDVNPQWNLLKFVSLQAGGSLGTEPCFHARCKVQRCTQNDDEVEVQTTNNMIISIGDDIIEADPSFR